MEGIIPKALQRDRDDTTDAVYSVLHRRASTKDHLE